MEEVAKIIESRKEVLFYYSPYNYIRSFDKEKQLELCVFEPILSGIKNDDYIQVSIDGYDHFFLLSHLQWDSNYFKVDINRLDFVLYDHSNMLILQKAIKEFLLKVLTKENVYLFINIPSEDIDLIQALGANGFRLIETRLNYFRDDLSTYNIERYKVRAAEEKDIPNLMRVANRVEVL